MPQVRAKNCHQRGDRKEKGHEQIQSVSGYCHLIRAFGLLLGLPGDGKVEAILRILMK